MRLSLAHVWCALCSSEGFYIHVLLECSQQSGVWLSVLLLFEPSTVAAYYSSASEASFKARPPFVIGPQ